MKYYIFEILRSSAKAEEFSLPPHFYIPDEDQPSTSSKDPKQESNAIRTPIKIYGNCTYCDKGFETDQAKLDHMRIHPNRDLKGTPERPATDVESNTNFFLPNSWAATRKYVWKPVTDKNSPDAITAALSLVEMSRSKSHWSYQNNNRTMESDPLDEKKHVSENYNKSFPSDQALVEHGFSHKKERKNEAIMEPTSRKRKRKVKSESGSHVCEICNKSYAKGQQLGGHKQAHYTKPENPTPINEVPNWSYYNNNMTMESDSLDEKKHVSENCNKSFPSDQALVEHGSSHKKEMKNEAILEPTSRKRKRKVKSESGSHVCEICNKSYARGQQLGGHKRAHYPKPKNPTPINEVPNWSYHNNNMTMESDSLDEKKHAFENCNKSFPSDQALVEHGSSHKKEMKNEAILEPTSRKRKRKVKSESGSHVCEICNKSYARGQQLGGHKRAHYPKPKNPTPISEVPNGQAALDS